MTRRLWELSERPVAPGVARAIVATAFAVTVALGCIVALGVGAHRHSLARHRDPTAVSIRPAQVASRPGEPRADTAPADASRPQDPQDRPGNPAHRRAARELAIHRALQHVPWGRGGVSIGLVGARDGKAILSVGGPTVAVARHGYRVFLRRFHDDGRSYLPRFVAKGGRS